MTALVFTLPWPPSVNGLFAGKGRRYPSPRYKRWQREAGQLLYLQRAGRAVSGPVDVLIELSPPDRRDRDADNHAKAPLDLLVKHRVLPDDNARYVRSTKVVWVDGYRSECRVTLTPAGEAAR